MGAEFRADELIGVYEKLGPGAIAGTPRKFVRYIPSPALIHGVLLTGGTDMYAGTLEDDEPGWTFYVRDGATVNLQSSVLHPGWEIYEKLQDYPSNNVTFWLPAVQSQRFFTASALYNSTTALQSAEAYWLGGVTNTSRYCAGPRTFFEASVAQSAGANNDGYTGPTSILICYTKLTQPTRPTPEEIRAYDEYALRMLGGKGICFDGNRPWPCGKTTAASVRLMHL